mgnify:CR=1 FL=1
MSNTLLELLFSGQYEFVDLGAPLDEKTLVIQLPPDQITPALAETTQAAWQRYCAAKIESNRQRRRLTTRKALRLWGYAGLILLFALALIFLFYVAPLQFLPGWLRAILSLLAIYAFALANWDALDSLLFDWAPFVRDNTTYRLISLLDLRFEPPRVPTGRQPLPQTHRVALNEPSRCPSCPARSPERWCARIDRPATHPDPPSARTAQRSPRSQSPHAPVPAANISLPDSFRHRKSPARSIAE